MWFRYLSPAISLHSSQVSETGTDCPLDTVSVPTSLLHFFRGGACWPTASYPDFLNHEDGVFEIKKEFEFSYHREHGGHGEGEISSPFPSRDSVEALKDHRAVRCLPLQPTKKLCVLSVLCG